MEPIEAVGAKKTQGVLDIGDFYKDDNPVKKKRTQAFDWSGYFAGKYDHCAQGTSTQY